MSETGLVRTAKNFVLTRRQRQNWNFEPLSSQIGSLEPDLSILKVLDKIFDVVRSFVYSSDLELPS